MTTPLKRWRPSKRLTAAQQAREKKRHDALSRPIRVEQVINARKYLVQVNHGHRYCWIYTAKSTRGKESEYAKMEYNGVWIAAHRFALAVKLGCTPWDLEGYHIMHAPVEVCISGRCCNPEHLSKGKRRGVDQRNVLQRSKDKRARP